MKPVTGFYLECNHLVAAITADRPCSVCSAIAKAVEAERERIRSGVKFIIKKETLLEPVNKGDCMPLLEEVLTILETDNEA